MVRRLKPSLWAGARPWIQKHFWDAAIQIRLRLLSAASRSEASVAISRTRASDHPPGQSAGNGRHGMNLDVNAQQLLASLLQSRRCKAWNNGYEPALERSNPSCSPIMLHATATAVATLLDASHAASRCSSTAVVVEAACWSCASRTGSTRKPRSILMRRTASKRAPSRSAPSSMRNARSTLWNCKYIPRHALAPLGCFVAVALAGHAMHEHAA
eukprot:scaffold90054_cov75-Phaeocystis_antarctica.AAC.7